VEADLEIHQREKEGIVILDMDGRLVVGPPAGEVRETIGKVHKSGNNQIILNLEKVGYIDSTGLGTLVICFTSLQKAGGALKLVNLNKRNLELLVLTKLSTVFELFNNEQDAVNSFFPDREIKRFDILDFIQEQRDQ
jgi:anti-sigma B factor antagonist